MLGKFSADMVRRSNYKLNQLKVELIKVLGLGLEVSAYGSGLVSNELNELALTLFRIVGP